ncbi:MAG: toll/interleukin-1 receptor domain-containing protein [Promethearchaeota archaeon]
MEELITSSFLADPAKFKLPFKAYKGDNPFIFVSYAHSDKLQTYPIMDYLNKSGFNIWYDEGISVSEDWKRSIVTNIENCKAFLVFITPHIIDSEYVRKEISYALSKKKPFYSVYLKDTTLPGELEFDISGIQSMKKYTMSDIEFYGKIKEVLSPILSGKN